MPEARAVAAAKEAAEQVARKEAQKKASRAGQGRGAPMKESRRGCCDAAVSGVQAGGGSCTGGEL